MILLALEVEGFRCFDRRIRVEDFAPGVNILFGPNGAGKSTLLQALRHVLLDSYGMKGENVQEKMTPWGRALQPRIVAEFAHQGDQWRLEKRFFSGAAAALERMENGVYRPVAAGKQAEDRVRTMLQAEAPAKGMAKQEHLGLLQVLWTPQGPPGLSPWNAGVRITLQEAFGAALRSPGDARLTGALAERFTIYFSPTGLEKKSSPVTQLRTQEADFRTQAAGLRAQWERAAAQREEAAILSERILARTPVLAARQDAVKAAQARQTDIVQARHAELQATQELQAISARVDGWRADIVTRQRLAGELTELGVLHEAAKRKLHEALALLPQLEECERQMEDLTQRGQDAVGWPDVQRLRDLDRQRQELRTQSAAMAAPAAAQMESIHRINGLLAVKRAALDASSLKLTLTAETALTLREGEESHAVEAGGTLEIRRPQSISIHLPGVARIIAASADEQASNLAREVEEFDMQLRELLGGLTVDEAATRYGQKATLDEQLRMRDAEASALEARRAALLALAARRPEWEEAPPDVPRIREEWRIVRERREALRAQADVSVLAPEEASLRTKMQDRQRTLEEIGNRLARHAAHGTLETLESRQNAAALQLLTATARRSELESCENTDLGAMEAQTNQLAAEQQADRERRAALEGELTAMQSQGIYTRLAETEERLAACTASLERETRRAGAVKLLSRSLEEASAQMTASLPERIAEVATQNWRAIAGNAAPAIRINAGWTPGGLEVPGGSAALDELSGGEAEQVAFATRLALASQLTQAGPQLAVFDDSFLATDPARAGRILDLLKGNAGHLQILILTCHPDRYRTLTDARHFDLEKLKQ